VRLLPDHKVGPTARTGSEKRAFHLAAEKNHDAVTGLLLDKDADINTEAESRWTAFYLVVYNGHEPVARLLLGRKTKLIMGTNTGDPPLHKASSATVCVSPNSDLPISANPRKSSKNTL
jgi:ankyrin repeat protein